ncbi:metallophosphoesterase [Hymenobacter ruricola]|uniref:Metallophosphoesterase n=1 Tax=Hymenobacter ruricola TaxID=2791023 RepID=A0ABS0I271_9BACT|nr:metallophosphoesterase [Hymenobacter ruricola]MBF9221002.1 metallophosphoesterase [Hymenobacter ruricola]
MNLFIIGDVHGCLHTLQELLTRWDPATEHLIQVGDLVDRGTYIPETVELARGLNEQYPASTTFLMGNHEDALLHHFGPEGPYTGWLKWGGRSTVDQYQARPELLARHLPWLAERPLFWENEHVLVSHAGITESAFAYDPDSSDGLLWARTPLKRLPQLQVVGHTPTEKNEPRSDKQTNSLYLDTGAVFGGNLTGVRLSPTGQPLEIIMIPVHLEDLLE